MAKSRSGRAPSLSDAFVYGILGLGRTSLLFDRATPSQEGLAGGLPAPFSKRLQRCNGRPAVANGRLGRAASPLSFPSRPHTPGMMLCYLHATCAEERTAAPAVVCCLSNPNIKASPIQIQPPTPIDTKYHRKQPSGPSHKSESYYDMPGAGEASTF